MSIPIPFLVCMQDLKPGGVLIQIQIQIQDRIIGWHLVVSCLPVNLADKLKKVITCEVVTV